MGCINGWNIYITDYKKVFKKFLLFFELYCMILKVKKNGKMEQYEKGEKVEDEKDSTCFFYHAKHTFRRSSKCQ